METCYTPFFCQTEVMPASQANVFYLLARMLFNINHYAMTSNILNNHLLRQLSVKHCARLVVLKRFYNPVFKTHMHISRVQASQRVR